MAMPASSPPAIRKSSPSLPAMRATRAGEELNLVDRRPLRTRWIVDFPFYEWDEDDKKVDFAHNPFSMPQGGMEALENQDPLTIKAYQYDLVCNGFEIASGGIRNHKPETMVKAFEIVGLSQRRSWKSASAASTAPSSTARRRMAAWQPAWTASSCCCRRQEPARE
jgi:aspartyl-tRNA synthetase